jgi:flagellar basal-body rod protein FlgB
MLIDPLSTNKVTQTLTKSLDIAALKQKVAASNLANIDTPGYKAKKLDFKDALKKAENQNTGADNFGLARTNRNHFECELENSKLTSLIEEDTETIPKNDGNNVDLDKEMVELTEANAVFKVTSRLLMDKIRMIKYTLREGR